MGANISTSSGVDGSTVKLACPEGHIMKGSQIKYGKFDNKGLYKNYKLPKKCLNKKNCSFQINKTTIKDDPAPGLDKEFEVTLACFEPPYIPGLKSILKKNLHKKNSKKKFKKIKKMVKINGETKMVQMETEEQNKPIVVLAPSVKGNKFNTLIYKYKFVILAILIIAVLWYLIMSNYKKMKNSTK